MSNDERNPKSECRKQRATGAFFGFRASSFFRISSFVIRHCPATTQITLTNTMNLKTNFPVGAGFFAGLLLGIGTVVDAAEYDRRIEKEFQVSPGGKLIVQADRGSIKINSNTSDRVHVRVLRQVKGGSQAEA